MNKKVSLSELSPLIMKTLQDGGEVILTVTGRSMFPMLRHRRDKVCLVKPCDGYLRKYDLPLFVRPDGSFILHRIVEVTRSGYSVMGDNQCVKEYPVLHSQVIGVAKGFWRDDKYIACDSSLYLFYSRLWLLLCPVRRLYLKSRLFIGRCIRLLDRSGGRKSNEG